MDLLVRAHQMANNESFAAAEQFRRQIRAYTIKRMAQSCRAKL